MAKDLVYQAAKNALSKDNWLITHDLYTISFGGVNMAVDLGAEKLIAATKDHQKIAVEIKSFLEITFRSCKEIVRKEHLLQKLEAWLHHHKS